MIIEYNVKYNTLDIKDVHPDFIYILFSNTKHFIKDNSTFSYHASSLAHNPHSGRVF